MDPPGTMEVTEKVAGIEVNQPIPDDLFTWESLQPPDGTAFLVAPDGRADVMKVAGNKLTPDPQFENRNLSHDLERLAAIPLAAPAPDAPPKAPDKSAEALAPQRPVTQPDQQPAKVWSVLAVSVPAFAILVAALLLAVRNRRSKD